VLVNSDLKDKRGIKKEEKGREIGYNMFIVLLV
jgi:hypothetical protein